MALINCPECGKEISDKSKACIHCGFPVQKSSVKKRHLQTLLHQIKDKPKNALIVGSIGFGLALIIIIISILCVSSNQNESASDKIDNSYFPSNDYEIVPTDLSIQEIVGSYTVWTSEGGISNPYDRYIFDSQNMILIYDFESSEYSNSATYNMQFVDEEAIEISGLRPGSESPAKLTIINENKLKITFIDNELNQGNYYLNKTNETYDADITSQSTGFAKKGDTTSQLTKDEERLLEYLKNSIDTFKKPSSVRVVEVYVYNDEDDLFYVDISAENSLGGTTKELYQVEKYDIYESISSSTSIDRMPYAFGESCSCDVSTINNLLKEYCTEMGWD